MRWIYLGNAAVQMTGLNVHVSIEGFFCIVRNTPEYHMKPHWHFTSSELEQYMHLAVQKKWDTLEVGTHIEAVAVAGCSTVSKYWPCVICITITEIMYDVIDMLHTSKQKADHLKAMIQEKICNMLST